MFNIWCSSWMGM